MSGVNLPTYHNIMPPQNSEQEEDRDHSAQNKKLQNLASVFFNILLPILLIPAAATYFIFSLVTTGELELATLSIGTIVGLFAFCVGRCLK